MTFVEDESDILDMTHDTWVSTLFTKQKWPKQYTVLNQKLYWIKKNKKKKYIKYTQTIKEATI